MQSFIKTLAGRKANFNFEPDNTVRHVKEALQVKEGIQVEQIRLIYGGKQMSDECTLQDYNVKPGSMVHSCCADETDRHRGFALAGDTPSGPQGGPAPRCSGACGDRWGDAAGVAQPSHART